MKIYEYIPALFLNGKEYKKKIEIKNPTEHDKWFYFIRNKNIEQLQNMVNNGFNINSIDPDGRTIAHYATSERSYKLLKFALQMHASFDWEDLSSCSPIDFIFSQNYNIICYKLILKGLSLHRTDILKSPCHRVNFIALAANDKNLSKIKFFIKNFSVSAEIKEVMLQQSIEQKAIENWKYLSGRGKLIAKLNKNLYSKPIQENIRKI